VRSSSTGEEESRHRFIVLKIKKVLLGFLFEYQ